MDKDHVLILTEVALTNQIDKPGHSFRGVDRIQQNTLVARQQRQRFQRSCGGKTVALADVIAIGHHGAARQLARYAQQIEGSRRQVPDVLFLLRLRRAHADA